MTPDATLALQGLTILGLTTLCVGPLKALLEVWLSTDNRAHDSLVQLMALLVGVAWALVFAWAYGPVTRTAVLQTVTSIVLGLLGGSGGVGTYHIATALQRATQTAPPSPPAGESAPQPAPQAPPATTGTVGPSVAMPPPEPPQTSTLTPVTTYPLAYILTFDPPAS